MLPRILSYIVFWLLMTLIILGSILIVMGLYLPLVAIKAVAMGLSGKLSAGPDESSPSAHKDAPDPAVHPVDRQSSR